LHFFSLYPYFIAFAIPFISFNKVLFTIQFVSCLFPQLGDVVAGLERGICTMKKGEKALIMPPPLDYEDKGAPGVPTGSELYFEVGLLSWLAVVDIYTNGRIVKKLCQLEGPDKLEMLMKLQVTSSCQLISLLCVCVFILMCFASLYPLILYDKWHFTHTVSYKIKLSYESIVRISRRIDFLCK
jgi:hypothetical protein